MILSAMRTLLGQLLAFDLDGFATAAADQTAQINFGIRTISRYIQQYDPSIPFTMVAGTLKYDLRSASFTRKVLVAKAVVINGVPLSNCLGTRNGMWSLEELERFNPTWRTDPTGTPSIPVQMDHYLYMYPPPSQGIIDTGNNFVVGTYLANDMVNGTDDATSPDIPEELHEAIVRIAAVYAADPNTTEQEGLARLSRYSGQAMHDMEEIRKRNMRLMVGWGTTHGRSRRQFILV